MDSNRLESFIFERMARSRLPGLSIALVEGDEITYARGLGQRDVDRGLPATPDTLYSVGSVTKSVTALAILQLAERGLLDPHDPVDRHLPFPWKPAGQTVTLEHLLTHSWGVPALGYSEALINHANGGGGRWLPIAGPEDVLTFMDGAEGWSEAAPGERWAYANEGYALLGLIVERVSGRGYEEFVRDEILRPLGMTRSFFSRDEVEAADDVAVPYVLPAGERPRPGHYLYRRIRSEGGLISSVVDLGRYLQMFLAGGKGVVSEETVGQMFQPRVDLPFSTNPHLLGSNEPAKVAQSYGYGLMSEEFMGRTLVSHGGSVLVSTAHIALLPEERLAVAVLANGSGYPLATIARAALAVALGEAPESVPAEAVRQRLERLEGNYLSYRGTIEATVRRQGDFLLLEFPNRIDPQQIILVPESLAGAEPRFYTSSEGRRLPVAFRITDGGTELIYERHKLRRT